MRKHLIGVDIGVYLCWFLFRLDISVGICVCFVYVFCVVSAVRSFGMGNWGVLLSSNVV